MSWMALPPIQKPHDITFSGWEFCLGFRGDCLSVLGDVMCFLNEVGSDESTCGLFLVGIV